MALHSALSELLQAYKTSYNLQLSHLKEQCHIDIINNYSIMLGDLESLDEVRLNVLDQLRAHKKKKLK